MRVLLSPQAESWLGGPAAEVADRLAGPEGTVVSLREMGIRDLSRPLSGAEVMWVREALLGNPPASPMATEGPSGGVVGYVCAGSPLQPAGAALASDAAGMIAVTDHANLTWRSPLTGPNDDRLGPRFPSMTGIYAPEVVLGRYAPGGYALDEGMIVVSGTVAGVFDDNRLSDHEAYAAALVGCSGVSVELAPVVVIMAHLGLKVAAAVLMYGERREMPGGGS